MRDLRPKSDSSWVGRAEICRVFDVSDAGWRKFYDGWIPEEYKRRAAHGKTEYFARGVLEAWREREAGRNPRRTPAEDMAAGLEADLEVPDIVAGGAEMLLTEVEKEWIRGSRSPALEKYRVIAGKLAVEELKQKRKELIPANEVRELLNRITSGISDAGTELRRRYGAEAAGIIEGALEAVRRELAGEAVTGHGDTEGTK